MRSRLYYRISVLLLACGASALKSPPPTTTTRRSVLAGVAAAAVSPLAAFADGDPLVNREGGALGATCLGFGCNPYGDLSYNGLEKEKAAPGSMPYDDFLKAIKEKRVEGVVFQPPSGDEAWALIDGSPVRMGAGWPVEIANSWSSPSWVVRILENEGVPYTWNFDLKAGTQKASKVVTKAEMRMRAAKTKGGGGYTANPYRPDAAKQGAVSALSTTNSKTGEGFSSAQPKMYGGAESAMDSEQADYMGLGLDGYVKPK